MFLKVQTLSRFGNSYFGFFLFFFSISREEDTTSGAATNSGVINTVSLKLPAFWPEEVEVWFAQTEAQFAIKRIMDSRTKFYYVVSVLPQDVAPQLSDLLRAPPATPYESLKDRLFQLYFLSDCQRFEALVNLPLVVDQKPSILMNKMLALYPADSKPDFMFRGHFLRLPAEIRSHLIHESIIDPRALKADALWQSRALFPVAHVSGNGRPGGSSKSKNQSSWQRSSTSSLPAPAPQSSSGSDNVYCRYHRKFGNNAHRCFQPCTWSENH